MAASGNITYSVAQDWEQLPKGYVHRDVAGVAVDGEDRVYLMCRGDHPVVMYDRDGNFRGSWGEGDFSYRTHGIYVAPNGTIFCTDDGQHTVRQFTPDGRLLMTMGTKNTPSDTGYDGKNLDTVKRAGPPFNRPTNVAIDQPLTFSSHLTGGIPANINPAYTWSVSAGRIIEGQGTDTIKIDTTGLGGQTVRATLSMGGYTLECSADCAVTIPLPKIYSRKFDEFPDISRNDEKARLDNFAIELQNDPTATAYVIVYPGRTSKRGDVQHHSSRIIEYLVHSRGLDERRIVTLVGAPREELFVQLWVAPQGSAPPTP